MRFTRYTDVHAFYRDTYDILMRDETRNMILLGNLIIGEAGEDKTGWRDPRNWLMAAVSDATGAHLTALMTPPHNVTLYATDNEIDGDAFSCLIDGLVESGVPVPGVMAEKALAQRFAEMYCGRAGKTFAVSFNQRIYELTAVNPDIPDIGTLRPARESDMSFFPYWIGGFNSDCFHTPLAVWPDAEGYRYQIAHELYILEDGGTPVSMAGITRKTPTACNVGWVYTPPYFRSRGYASACVAALSRLMLARGFAKCSLYTDLANPTSNSIYQKIGYVPLCDSLELRFE